MPYCIQAYWYFYEGCVLNQVSSPCSQRPVFRFEDNDRPWKFQQLRDIPSHMRYMLTLQLHRPTPSRGLVRVSVPFVRRERSKDWRMQMIQTLRLGAPETLRGRVARVMRICRTDTLTGKIKYNSRGVIDRDEQISVGSMSAPKNTVICNKKHRRTCPLSVSINRPKYPSHQPSSRVTPSYTSLCATTVPTVLILWFVYLFVVSMPASMCSIHQ